MRRSVEGPHHVGGMGDYVEAHEAYKGCKRYGGLAHYGWFIENMAVDGMQELDVVLAA